MGDKSLAEILKERGIDQDQLRRELNQLSDELGWQEFGQALEELPILKGQPTWLKLVIAFLWGMATVSSLASAAALSALIPWEAQA